MTTHKTSRQIASDVKEMISWGMRQRDVAKRLKVSDTYLSLFLSGKCKAGPAILKALGYDTEPFYRPKRARCSAGRRA